MLKFFKSNIFFFIILNYLVNGCGTIIKIPEGQKILKEERYIKNDEILNKDPVMLLSVTRPNSKLLGFPLKLQLNNLVTKNPDSSFNSWLNSKQKRRKRMNSLISPKQVEQLKKYKINLNNWIKKNSEEPVLVSKKKIDENIDILKQYYKNIGYFNTEISNSINTSRNKKKAIIEYKIKTGKQFIIDSISYKIESKSVSDIYKKNISKSKLKSQDPFNVKNFDIERERLVNLFKNNGIYDFQQKSIRFKVYIDSLGIDSLIPVIVEISDSKKRLGDSLYPQSYEVKKIKKINIIVEDTNGNNLMKFNDSIFYDNKKIFYNKKLNYKAKVLTDVIDFSEGDIYNEEKRDNTFRYITELKNFKYPSITFKKNFKDSLGLDLSVVLTPMERFSLGFDLDLSHSNIEDFGIGFGSSIITRNLFKETEIIELSIKGSIGSSTNVANSNRDFFNLFEIGTDLRIEIPKIIFPLKLNSIIPKFMLPKTNITFGTSLQENIGLDRQNFASKIEYEWSPNKTYKINFKLLDLEFIKNRAINNYFNVYKNSFDRLNSISQNFYSNPEYLNSVGSLIIPNGTSGFIQDIINQNSPIESSSNEFSEVIAIKERQERLTSDNFIMGSSITFLKNNQQNLLDEDFSQYRFKLEWVGNLINGLLSLNKKDSTDPNNFLGVIPSQFIKTEFNYIKHWKIGFDRVLAFRGFSGIAIPYGSSNSIPFTRSYFGGGSNDNRAWRVYKLGPGTSENLNEFNEANFKLAFNLEYRAPLIGPFKGAIFIDAGNIWNAFDNISDPKMKFNGFEDLSEIAIGIGFGIRYDFNFFVFRLDTGFKAYNPVLPLEKRWWNQTSFKNAVYNIGINYPF